MNERAKTLIKEIKSFFIKTDNCKEVIEDAMANVLENLNKNASVQEVEKALILAGLKAGVTYIQAQTGASLSPTDEQYKDIVDKIMDTKNKLMPKVIKQLRKR